MSSSSERPCWVLYRYIECCRHILLRMSTRPKCYWDMLNMHSIEHLTNTNKYRTRHWTISGIPLPLFVSSFWRVLMSINKFTHGLQYSEGGIWVLRSVLINKTHTVTWMNWVILKPWTSLYNGQFPSLDNKM